MKQSLLISRNDTTNNNVNPTYSNTYDESTAKKEIDYPMAMIYVGRLYTW